MAPLRYPAILCSLCYAVGTDLDVVVVKVAMSETRESVPALCECACRNGPSQPSTILHPGRTAFGDGVHCPVHSELNPNPKAC